MQTRTTLVLLATTAVALVWGCTSSNQTLPDADFFVSDGQPFLIRVGETAGVQTAATINIVRFAGVPFDTRCPETSTCETPGFATVVLSVQSALAVSEVEINVPPEGDVTVQVEELSITVIELRPAAEEGVEINQLDYVVALRVSQTEDLGIT